MAHSFSLSASSMCNSGYKILKHVPTFMAASFSLSASSMCNSGYKETCAYVHGSFVFSQCEQHTRVDHLAHSSEKLLPPTATADQTAQLEQRVNIKLTLVYFCAAV